MRKRIRIAGTVAIVLLSGMVNGCRQENAVVDYSMDSEANVGREVQATGSLSQFQEEKWSTHVSGEDIDVTISAQISVPKAEEMSVIEVSHPKADAEYRKEIFQKIFGDSVVYYFDDAHAFPADIQNRIHAEEIYIENIEPYLDATASQDFDVDEVQMQIQQANERIRRYQEYLANATGELTVAQNYEQDIPYVGYVDDVLYKIEVSEESGTGIQISFFPYQSADVCPDDLEGKEGLYCSSDDAGGDNQCQMSETEAKKIAEDYCMDKGFENLLVTETKTLVWRWNDGSCVNGYEFWLEPGYDGIAFPSFGSEDTYIYLRNCVGYSMENLCKVWVTDKGVIGLEYRNPIAIDSVTEGVPLLSLECIQQIMKDEVSDNYEKYEFANNAPFYNCMDLIYLRIKDEQQANTYSYIPAWRLSYFANDYYNYSVFVNAMDGTIIYLW